MSLTGESSSPQTRAENLTTPSPSVVRNSDARASELRQYIHGLLPAHVSETVDVRITESVPTAAVLPATEDALATDGKAGVGEKEAQRLIDSVDGDYLVLVTGRETPNADPLNDELSADRAHQFGLAFHETLHILKTAFASVQALLRERVDEQYRDFVHDLINATEDGAIEHEVYVGDDFSNRAGDRLRLVREIHKRSPEDYEDLPQHQTEFTFRDALQKAIHDNVILPPSGTTAALIDENDRRVTFASDEARKAFEQVYPEIEALADDIHQLRGDVDLGLHKNDISASIKRAKRTIRFWEDTVRPFFEQDDGTDASNEAGGEGQDGDSSKQDSGRQRGGESSRDEQGVSSENQGRSDTEANPDDPVDETSSSGEQHAPGTSTDEDDGSAGDGASQGSDSSAESDSSMGSDADINGDELSLDRNAVASPLQGVADHPSVMDEPSPEDVELDDVAINEEDPKTSSSTDSDGEPGEDAAGGNASPEDSEDVDEPTDSETPESSSADSEHSHSSDSSSSDEDAEDSATDLAETTKSAQGEESQSTLLDFGGDSESTTAQSTSSDGQDSPDIEDVGDSNESGSEESPDSKEELAEENEPKNEAPADDTEQAPQPDEDCSGEEDGEGAGTDSATESPESSKGSEASHSHPRQPEEDESCDSSSEEGSLDNPTTSDEGGSGSESELSPPQQVGGELTEDDFQADRKRAEATAEEISGDTEQLEEELQALDRVLDDTAESDQSSANNSSGAGDGQLSTLEILPESGSSNQTTDWGLIEKGADKVANTLAKQLRLDKQTERRSGLTSGTKVNRKAAYRLGHNDPRVFEQSISGDEKEYFIVLVLDRSDSMAPSYYKARRTDSDTQSKIDVATDAVAKFTVACEDLGIDVAVVDFVEDTARLAKPTSIEAEYAQEALLTKDVGGGTPLSDAVTLASQLTEKDSKNSIIINITDGKPREVEDTRNAIKRSIAPVCSLTIATDCTPGNPPSKAEELDEVYEQSTTVFDPGRLNSRIDEFASLLGAF